MDLYELKVKGVLSLETFNKKSVNVVSGDRIFIVKDMGDKLLVRFSFDMKDNFYGDFCIDRSLLDIKR